MTFEQLIWTFSLWAFLIGSVYTLTGWRKIADCYSMWFTREYWKPYNIVEAASWLAKAIIIIPGLVFGIQIWWLYFFALLTSLTLIWASNEKLLPTLVGFNTLWVWLAVAVIVQNLLK
jgi:hypothetical protein